MMLKKVVLGTQPIRLSSIYTGVIDIFFYTSIHILAGFKKN